MLRLRGVLALAAGFLLGTAAQAGPMLTITSAANLNQLRVGQTVTFNVNLSGLNAGDTVDFLGATVVYDKTLLGLPTEHQGPIVPDPTGFLTAPAAGTADASYDDLFTGTPISANGVFFSFDVPVLKSGSGTLSFSFTEADGTNRNGGALPAVTTGAPLPVVAPSVVVPEPSTLALLALGGTLAGWRRWRRRSAATMA